MKIRKYLKPPRKGHGYLEDGIPRTWRRALFDHHGARFFSSPKDRATWEPPSTQMADIFMAEINGGPDPNHFFASPGIKPPSTGQLGGYS